MAARTKIREYLDRMANIPPDDWTKEQHAEAMSLLHSAFEEPYFQPVEFETAELLEAGPAYTININVESDPMISQRICEILEQTLKQPL